MKETWKPIPGYEGLYEASDIGRIKSLDRRGSDGRKLKGVVLTPQLSGPKMNYLMVRLSDYYGKVKNLKVHRLVYLSFSETEIPKNRVIDHINGDTLDNSLKNLQCITQNKNVSKCVDRYLPSGVYEKPNGMYYSHKYIDGKQFYLGSHWLAEVVERFYLLASKTLIGDQPRWNEVKSIIAKSYEERF